MKTISLFTPAVLMLLGSPFISGVSADQVNTTTRRPVLVELFTSEGCSDCPDADRLLARLVATQPVPNVEIIGMEEHIDYWNNRRWGDPFSARFFTNRQYAYSDHFNDNSVYTPEMVIDGEAHFVGSDSDAALSAIASAAHRQSAELNITQSKADNTDTVTVTVSGIPTAVRTDVYVVLTEDSIFSHVPDGENAGRTLRHGSVVREVAEPGSITGSQQMSVTTSLTIPEEWRSHPLKIAAFVQSPTTLRVYGAACADVP